MADGLAYTPGSGATVATDDCGASGHAQIFKLAYSADGSASLVLANVSGLGVQGAVAHDVAAAGNPVLLGAYAKAAAPSDVSADADVARLWSLLNGALCVNLTAAGALIPGDATNGLKVQVATLPASTNTLEVVGDVAHDAPAAGNPVLVGAYAKAAAPTDVSADGDLVRPWALLNGSLVVNLAAAGALIPGDATLGLKTNPQGSIAHDAADSGNPIKIGGRAVTALSTATLVAAADRSDFVTDADGAQITRPYAPGGDQLYEVVSNTNGSATASSVFGATASTHNYLTAIAVFNTSATAGYIDFTDDTGGTVMWRLPLPAGGGAVMSFTQPLRQATANKAIYFDVSAALSTVHICLQGFKSKV